MFPGLASLTFQGKKFVAILQANNWPGVFRVKRNGTDAEILALRSPAGHEGLIILESPAAPTSPVIFVAAIILFAGCAYWFGPIRSGRSGLPWLIFFLSVVHVLFWATQCIGTTNDSPTYVDSVLGIFHGGSAGLFSTGLSCFTGTGGKTFQETIYWEGGCTLIQHGMIILGAVWILFSPSQDRT